jgi:hypothetical protein
MRRLRYHSSFGRTDRLSGHHSVPPWRTEDREVCAGVPWYAGRGASMARFALSEPGRAEKITIGPRQPVRSGAAFRRAACRAGPGRTQGQPAGDELRVSNVTSIPRALVEMLGLSPDGGRTWSPAVTCASIPENSSGPRDVQIHQASRTGNLYWIGSIAGDRPRQRPRYPLYIASGRTPRGAQENTLTLIDDRRPGIPGASALNFPCSRTGRRVSSGSSCPGSEGRTASSPRTPISTR